MPVNIINNEKHDVFFIGDVHGCFAAIAPWIKQHDLRDCIIIFCGDFGLGFEKLNKETSDLQSSDRECDTRNIDCYILRGNHDDPEYYNSGIELNLKRFKPISDYTVISTPEHKILCVGGAVSVDRAYRKVEYEERLQKLFVKKYSVKKAKEKTKLYWWKNEPFVLNTDAIDSIIEQGIIIDTVATHTAPDFCFPSSKGHYWARLDPTLTSDLNKERTDMTRLYTYLQDKGMKPLNWFYGHYHTKKVESINDTKFVLLDMGRNSKNGEGVGGVFDMAELR